jgi:hypothetical protein
VPGTIQPDEPKVPGRHDKAHGLVLDDERPPRVIIISEFQLYLWEKLNESLKVL